MSDEINQAANTCSQEVYKGRDDYLVILESEEELKSLTPNFKKFLS